MCRGCPLCSHTDVELCVSSLVLLTGAFDQRGKRAARLQPHHGRLADRLLRAGAQSGQEAATILLQDARVAFRRAVPDKGHRTRSSPRACRPSVEIDSCSCRASSARDSFRSMCRPTVWARPVRRPRWRRWRRPPRRQVPPPAASRQCTRPSSHEMHRRCFPAAAFSRNACSRLARASALSS